MNWLDKLFGKQRSNPEPAPQLHELLSEGRSTPDNLGLAANAKHAALDAVRDKRYDDAWRLFHEQKTYFLQHAQSSGFTAQQTLALDGSVHEDLANIRRLESKHNDALIHILYCVITSAKPSKSLQQKVTSYFARCKFTNVTLQDLESFIQAGSRNPDFRSIQLAVAQWQNRA